MSEKQSLINRIRELLMDKGTIEEKNMFSGLCFMLNEKLCICVNDEELLCRLDPAIAEEILDQHEVRPMIHNGRLMKGYVFVDHSLVMTSKGLQFWVNLCLDYNPSAKAAKKKSKGQKS